MVTTGKEAYKKLTSIEATLPDIVMVLLGQSVSVCDDNHPSYLKVGHICDVNITVTSCHLQIHMNDETAEPIIAALEAGEETEGHPWFKMDEIEIIGDENAPVH